MDFLETVWNEMGRGNFSFLILLVGVLQLMVMCKRRNDEKRNDT